MTSSPVVDEAARLLEALQGWFADASSGLPLATGSAECELCPLCQLMALLRRGRPEVLEHLTEASAALLAAARAVLETHEHRGPTRSGARVEHIDIGD